MAAAQYLKNRSSKNGYQFQLIAYLGYDSEGNQIKRTTAWRSRPGIMLKTAERDALQAAAEFESELKRGNSFDDCNTRFEEFAKAYLDEQFHLASRTKDIYADIIKHTLPFIGDLKLCEIKKSHIKKMYSSGATKYETECFTVKNFAAKLKKQGWSRTSAARILGVNIGTLKRLEDGEAVKRETAEKIALGFETTVSEFFKKSTNNNPMAMSTVLKHHTFLVAVFNAAVDEKLIETSPTAGFKKKDFRYDKPPIYIPTFEEQRRIYSLVEQEPYQLRNMVKLFMNTGMRRGELLGLKWEDVDFEKGVINIGRRTIVHTNHDGDVVEYKAKTLNSVRVFPMNETIKSILLDQKRQQEEYAAPLGTYWKREGWIFTSEDGDHLCTNTPTISFKKFVKKNGLNDELHIHSLRHIFVSNYISKTHNMYSLSRLVGDTPETLQKVYIHVLESELVGSMDAMEGFYNAES